MAVEIYPKRNGKTGVVSLDEQLAHMQRARISNPEFFNALEGGTNGPVPHYSKTIGWIWCNWIERNCRLGEGDLYGQPPRLTGTQRALLWKLGELADETLDDPIPMLRFNLALVSHGKGGGKSPFGGWIGSLSLAGPRVPAGWVMTDRWGRLPTAKPRTSPKIMNMASSYEQADLILDEIRVTFDQGPPKMLKDIGGATTEKGRVALKKTRGEAVRVPATPKKADGSKATDLLVDEMHEFEGDRQERAYNVASGGTLKRENGLVLILSTAGYDLTTVFGRMCSRGFAGKFERHELFVYTQADESLDPQSDDDIAEGIRQANPLARAGVANVRHLVAKFKEMPLFQAVRYYWNRWTSTDESWLPAGAWDSCRGEWVEDRTLPTWIGVDMAKNRDSAALVILQLRKDGKYQAKSITWIPDGGELIPQDKIDKLLVDLAKKYGKSLEWITGDEAWWPSLGELEKKKDPAFEHEDQLMPIFRMPQQGRNMVYAYTRLYRLIVDRVLVQDGDPTFADQISSAAPQSTDKGWTLRKGKMRRRIDSAPALASAVFASSVARERAAAPVRSRVF